MVYLVVCLRGSKLDKKPYPLSFQRTPPLVLQGRWNKVKDIAPHFLEHKTKTLSLP